jgi:hypothetical protein
VRDARQAGERARRDREGEGPAPDRTVAPQLLDRQIDAPPEEDPQRALDALVGDQPGEIPGLAAGVASSAR